MSKSSKTIINYGFKLGSLSLLIRIIDFLRGTIFIKLFTPYEFGLLDIVNQLSLLSKYTDLGFLSNVNREYNFDSVNDKKKSDYRKSVSYGIDFLITLILVLVIVLVGFFSSYSLKIRIAIILSSISLFSIKGLKIIRTEKIILKKYNTLASLNLNVSLFENILTVSVSFILGIFSPLYFKPFILLFLFIYFWKKSEIKLRIDKDEFKRQLSFGLILTSVSILFGGWIFYQRYLITNYFSLSEVGIFSACLFIVKLGSNTLQEFIRPLSIEVKESLVNYDFKILKNYILIPSMLIFILSYPLVFITEIIFNFISPSLFSNYENIMVYFKIIKWFIPIYLIYSVTDYLILSKGVDRFKGIYFLYVLKFILISLLCGLFPPSKFETLLIYFLFSELFFFYGKLNLIFSKFYGYLKTLIGLTIIVSINFILISKNIL